MKKTKYCGVAAADGPYIVVRHKKRLLSRVSGRGFFVAGIRYYIFSKQLAPTICQALQCSFRKVLDQ
jgi:hypothetical protein